MTQDMTAREKAAYTPLPVISQLSFANKAAGEKTEAEIKHAFMRAAEIAQYRKEETPEYVMIANFICGPTGRGTPPRDKTVRRVLRQRAAGIGGTAKRLQFEDWREMHPTKGWRL